MAGKKENLKSLFTNTRTRIIIILTGFLFITAVVIGAYKFFSATRAGSGAASSLTNSPNAISSIPGAIEPTAQYEHLQQEQNVSQAKKALEKGVSAIPTIIRTQQLGEGVSVVGPQQGKAGVGFITLAQEQEATSQQSMWIQDLKDKSCSKTTVSKVINEGAQLTDLKQACSCVQLQDLGYSVADLQQVCSCKELRAAGFNARQLKSAGYTAGRLRECGFDACEERAAGFTAQQMKDGEFSDGELKGSGFSDQEIAQASGLPDGINAADVRKAGCQLAATQRLHASGVSASAIRRSSGCSTEQLKSAGYSAQELKSAGFTAADLANSGFSPEDLVKAGFDARNLLNAGFTPQQLATLDYSPTDIAAAESELPPGITAQEVKNSKCTVAALRQQRQAGVSAKLIKEYAHCTSAEIQAAGFTKGDLKNAGFSANEIGATNAISDDEIRAAGCDSVKLHSLYEQGVTAQRLHQINGCSATALKAAGYGVKDLVDAGFKAKELVASGFTPAQIKHAEVSPDTEIRAAGCDPVKIRALQAKGVSALKIHEVNSCNLAALKQAGYGVKELVNGGFKAGDLQASGFSPAEVKQAQVDSEGAIRAAGCDTAKLQALNQQGVSAERIHELNGCSASALKAAGYSARDLVESGFSPQDLLAAGFSPDEIKEAQANTDTAIKAAGCDPVKLQALFEQGVAAQRIHQLNGCTAAALKAAGYGLRDLVDAGFSPQDLLAAGFTPAQIKQAMASSDSSITAAGCDQQQLRALHDQGVSAARIHQLNGCSAAALKAAGFNAADLMDAGFSNQDLLAAGFAPEQLKAGPGVTDAVIKAAGCEIDKLKGLLAQGVTAKQIKDLNGCSAAALKQAGYDSKALTDAGFIPDELVAAGFTPEQMIKAGLSAADIIAAGRRSDCSVVLLQTAHADGINANAIKKTLGCHNATALKAAGFSPENLKAAGFTAAELKGAGFNTNDLKAVGYSAKDLRDAGFSALDLKNAGFTAKQMHDAGMPPMALKAAGYNLGELKSAGYNATDLQKSGFSPQDIQKAGFSVADLKNAGFSASELKKAGVSVGQLKQAGYTDAEVQADTFTNTQPMNNSKPGNNSVVDTSSIAPMPGPNIQLPNNGSKIGGIPSISGATTANNLQTTEVANAEHLQKIIAQQNQRLADQRYQQQIQQRSAQMLGVANRNLQDWKAVVSQTYVGGKESAVRSSELSLLPGAAGAPNVPVNNANPEIPGVEQPTKALIKTGDIIFAVLDTSVNSDQPGPILATIVTGPFKGAKLIGSFNLPSNSDTMVISFNTMSVPGAAKSTSINAYAIDPNTARTALSSRTDHHYLLRYGSLFASSFLEGFGNAFQSANTTVQIGGTGSGDNFTIQNGIGRSTLENAVIGMATLGKSWGQVAQQQFSTPVTVEVFSGTPMGILFTQDLTSL